MAAVIAKRSTLQSGMVTLVKRGGVRDCDSRLSVNPQAHECGPQGDSFGEHPGSVDGINDPSTAVLSRVWVALLAEDAIVGKVCCDRLSNRQFGGGVRLSYWRGVRFYVDRKTWTELVEGDFGGDICQMFGKRQVVRVTNRLHSLGSVVPSGSSNGPACAVGGLTDTMSR
jgi:hypothetical protein